ncbi:PEP-utilizing protein mobile region [Chondrocystis sp. NIES-4102]|nr:PEP-utilizing protein mobile region [Chondrocystis sp. NIES-4102]
MVGDQLFILSQLLQHSCPILPGFVLGNNLFKEFISSLENNLSNCLDILDVDDYQALGTVAKHSRWLITQAIFSPQWQQEILQAVQQLNCDRLILQPYLTFPFRPQQQSKSLWQPVTCTTDPQAITTAIKQVWSQLFSASSLLYCYKLGLSIDQIGLAVLVRPLAAVYASGTIELTSEIVRIQATWGLPTSILQGDVEADHYHLDRNSQQIISRHLGHKNYAYRPLSHPLINSSIDCLESYIPQEAESETYVLDPKAIALLLESTQTILQQQPQIRYFVWTLPKPSHHPHSLLNFYFTQIDEHLICASNLTVKTTQASLPSSVAPLLTGVGVSPGKVMGFVVILDEHTLPHSLPPNSILVTKSILPKHLPLLEQVKGIITETGGITSHGAIVARELNIPAVVQVADATHILQTDVKVLLDGDEGKIYPANIGKKLSSLDFSFQDVSNSNYPLATKLMVNLSQPAGIAKALNLPVDGVGLLRSDLLLSNLLASQSTAQWLKKPSRQRFIDTLTGYLRDFVSAFAPRPVFYRSLDWYAQDQVNQVFSNRGTYNYLQDPTLFDLELEALRVIINEGYSNLKLILPFIRSVEEFKFCYRRLETFGLTTYNSFQVWIMAEVPSVIFLLPEYIKAGVQGIAIGTNDLTQLLLGVSREQTEFSDRGLNANHPAMQSAIAQLVTTATANNIECCICGQAPVIYPSLIDKLISWGIGSISVEPEAIEQTYLAIARAERRLLLQAAVGKVNSD